MNVPPQHGKSRTLVNFSAWVFGKNPNEKIITGSYNDDTASDFSRYTRDAITQTKNEEHDVVYADIFPGTRIKKGHSGFEKWALDGQHFSYLGAGVGGSVTSKGATILIIDDPIKGAIEALNDNVLDKTWLWYTSTFLSRVSAVGGEPIEIVNHTRWSKKDIFGRIMETESGPTKGAKDWYVIKMEAMNRETGEMLCDGIFNRKRYDDLKELQPPEIFDANYHQEPIDIKGKLFVPTELTYFLPEKSRVFESSVGYVDVADQGNDYTAAPVGRNVGTEIYITDVVFSKLNTDHTIPMCAEMFNREAAEHIRVEANSMGHWFGRDLRKDVQGAVYPSTSTTNKHTRILMAAPFIIKYCRFVHPDHQSKEYKEFMRNLFAYNKEGKVENDDAPDSMSGLTNFIRHILSHLYDH